MSELATHVDDVPVWQKTRDRYQSERGVHRPHIAEISPMQMGMMSQRAKEAYQKKRSAEWAASEKCATEFAQACFEAYLADPTILRSPRISEDARKQISFALRRSEQAEREARAAAAHRENRLSSKDQVSVGDRVWALLGGCYITVEKVFSASVRGRDDQGRSRKVAIKALMRLSYQDLQEQLGSEASS